MGQVEELGEVGPEMARTVWGPSAIKTMLEQELASKRLLEAKAIKTMLVVD